MSPTRQDQRACPRVANEVLVTRSVEEAEGLDRLFEDSLPAFGGSDVRRVWQLLDEAIGKGIPMSLAVSGPVTLSGQHLTWLNPLLEAGWFMLVSTTDAVCYHDGHRALNGADKRPFFRVSRHGDTRALRDESTIRDGRASPRDAARAGTASSALPRLPEFQRRMKRARPPTPRPALRRAGEARTRSRRACSRSVPGSPSRSSSARRPTARCS
jgi:deoxyhypusine synthase